MSQRTELLERVYFELMDQMFALGALQDAVLEFNATNPDERPITADDCPWLLQLEPRRESLDKTLAEFETYLERQYDARGQRL